MGEVKMQEKNHKISKGIDFLLEHNDRVAAEFNSEEAKVMRLMYRERHPTAICVLKCMDGRVNFALLTETPPGLIQPWRSLGGIFDLGWPAFNSYYRKWQNYVNREGRDVIVFASYHYSKSDIHLGCRGWGGDTDAAFAFTGEEAKQFATQPGERAVYPIRIGIETDEDALIFHNDNGGVLDLSKESKATEESLALKISRLYPSFPERIVADLLPLVNGNIRHIRELRKEVRKEQDSDHKEWILAVGKGFDWLHIYNQALIVGPWESDFSKPLLTAAGILWDNIAQGRVVPSERGILLLANYPVWNNRLSSQQDACILASSLAKQSYSLIQEHLPELAELMEVLVGTTEMETHRFTPLTTRC